MANTTRSEVSDAVGAVKRAEEALTIAEERLAAARDDLDAALAKRMWMRLHGAFGPNTRLYESVMHPGATVALPEVLKAVAYEDARS